MPENIIKIFIKVTTNEIYVNVIWINIQYLTSYQDFVHTCPLTNAAVSCYVTTYNSHKKHRRYPSRCLPAPFYSIEKTLSVQSMSDRKSFEKHLVDRVTSIFLSGRDVLNPLIWAHIVSQWYFICCSRGEAKTKQI